MPPDSGALTLAGPGLLPQYPYSPSAPSMQPTLVLPWVWSLKLCSLAPSACLFQSLAVSQTGKCWVAITICADLSAVFLKQFLHSLLRLWISPSVLLDLLPSEWYLVWRHFFFHSSPQGHGSCPNYFSLLFYFLLPYWVMWIFSCLFGSLRSFACVL